jgi:hypothetical protein
MRMNLAGLLPLLGGAIGALLAFGVIPISNDPVKAEEWHGRWGTILMAVCPLIILFGLLQLFCIVPSATILNWYIQL